MLLNVHTLHQLHARLLCRSTECVALLEGGQEVFFFPGSCRTASSRCITNMHITDNPTDPHEYTHESTQITVDDWTNTTAHPYEPKQFGFLGETTSHTGFEPNAQLDDMTSNHLASIRGDSASVSCACSVDENSATTVQASDVRSAPRTRMHDMTLRSAAFPVERSSATLWAKRSRCLSSARTVTRGTAGSATGGHRTTTPC